MKWQCPHNEAVECSVKECDRCGWNPETVKKRKEAAAREAGICIHNPQVECDKQNCENCGWDPTVAAVRKRRNLYGISGNHE